MDLLVGILTILFFASSIWINFHGQLWYNHDIWYDAYIARLMSEQQTLFPKGWLFGNQYYIVATPVLAACIHSLTHSTFIAMAVASCFMMLFIILSFIYFLRAINVEIMKGCGKIGVLCLIGGCIIGNSAARDFDGLQLLYTMCSYYSSYFIVAFLCLGVYFRMRVGRKVNPIILILSILLTFGIGMNSLREMLILIIPLICLAGLQIIIELRNQRKILLSSLFNRRNIYVAILFFANLFGFIYCKRLAVPQQTIIGEQGGFISFSALLENLFSASKQFLRLIGFRFIQDGFAFLPLWIISIVFLVVVAYCVFSILKGRKTDNLSYAILLFVVSLIGVFIVGVFIIHVRSVYFFTYYPLVALSFIYLLENSRECLRKAFTIAIVLVSTLCYCYNFIPDFKYYRDNNLICKDYSDSIIDSGIQCIYCHTFTSPVVVQYTENVIMGSFWFRDEQEGAFLSPVMYLNTDQTFSKANINNCLIALSNYSIDHLENHYSKEYVDSFFSQISLEKQLSTTSETIFLYKPKDPTSLFHFGDECAILNANY